MALPPTRRRLTEAEYLAFERSADFKNEFFDGEVFAMAGGTLQHALIAANLTRALGNRLEKRECTVYSPDLRLKLSTDHTLYTYADLTVICGPAQLLEGSLDTVLNPTLIAEVLSESTEAYDRGKKFELYRQISTLREYLLVSQKEPRIEQYIRQDDEDWLMKEACGLDAVINLPSIQVSVPIREVYAKVEFPPPSLRVVAGPD